MNEHARPSVTLDATEQSAHEMIRWLSTRKARGTLRAAFVSRHLHPEQARAAISHARQALRIIYEINPPTLAAIEQVRHQYEVHCLRAELAWSLMIIGGMRQAHHEEPTRALVRTLSSEPELKRRALVEKLEPYWPNLRTRLNHLDENGLRKAAHSSRHGFWRVQEAINWAIEHGDFKPPKPTRPRGPWR